MKRIVFILIVIFLFSGCVSEAERENQISQLNLQLEQERQRLDIPQDPWDEYVTNFKNRKCGGWEYQWGKNWRYWAIKDGEEYFTSSHPLITSIVEQHRINRDYNLLVKDVNEFTIKQTDYIRRNVEFLNTLNDDQLSAYKDLTDINLKDKGVDLQYFPEWLIQEKKLENLLSREQLQKYLALGIEAGELNKEIVQLNQRYTKLVQRQQGNNQVVQTYIQLLPTIWQIRQQQAEADRQRFEQLNQQYQQFLYRGQQQQQHWDLINQLNSISSSLEQMVRQNQMRDLYRYRNNR
jgi:hypothetical protein